MPVWHEAAQQWVRDGRIVMLGVTQEQHPERCQLFAQWHGIQWPILHDPINVLKTTAVPIFVAIDEHGIVRSVRPRLEGFESEFLDKSFANDAPRVGPPLTPPAPTAQQELQAPAGNDAAELRRWADSVAIWRSPERVEDAMSAYQRVVKLDPRDMDARFRLGVCFRMRSETERRQDHDFARAVRYWEEALHGQPNQYIWRRRIQQYGPRLIKPYPFYDWVARAQREISQRGQTPIRLPVLPSGAEIASPSRNFQAEHAPGQAPDPQGAIRRDVNRLIATTVTVVPTRAQPGETVRVHVMMAPSSAQKAYWNNEVEPTQLWIDSPAGWDLTRQLLTAPLGVRPETQEVRRLDFEVRVPATASAAGQLNAYALYYVCEDEGGTCLYLRQDIPIEIPIAGSQ